MVIGGGPAGSTIATLLRQRGRSVTVLEKEQHPRFHIGESLLPQNLRILERLGVLDQVRAIGVPKHGAEFNSQMHSSPVTYYFENAVDKRYPYAYEVRRSEFDHLLLQNAACQGADVHQCVRVVDVDLRAGARSIVHGVDEHGNRSEWHTRFVVDASGRDTLLANKMGWKQKNPKHNSAAIFGHFDNVVRRSGRDEGNISVCWFEHGWFWMIPLRDGRMSVGAVCFPEYLRTRKTSPEEFLWQTIRACPSVNERMREATLTGEVRATGNYSYTSRRMYGDGFLLVGDANAFVDPVFSSGVYLAMSGATAAAEAVDVWLRDARAGERLLRRYQRDVRRAIRMFSWFIYRFTSPAMRSLFMAPGNVLRMEEAVTSMLAGDVYGASPIRAPLALFKVVYYVSWVLNLRRAWAVHRRRRRNARVQFVEETQAGD
ncbi:MAG: tryptophan 7-halogenase [Pseudomonadota bacterium]|nr:MAG: tryptophan 7-halogenase [Pseudomonadota bacterium]